MELYLSAKGTVQFLVKVVIFLAIASVLVNLYYFYLPNFPLRNLLKNLFDLDSETNIPSVYAAGAILFCSILMAIIAQAQKLAGNSNFRSWLGFSLVFAYLSMDEFMSLHENVVVPMRKAFHTGGLLYFPWVILGSIFLVIFLIVFGKFIASLPAKTRRLFFIAGIIYVVGALGFEMLGGLYASHYGETNIIYVLMTTIEEVLEMLGIIAFIYALLTYMSAHMKGVDVGIHIIDSKKQHLSS
ncbi:hypothetical protein BV372_13805 [Nostoc sp. T09]|nr:hypothetical protein BV372_13805 [Nostoc sp. T09]